MRILVSLHVRLGIACLRCDPTSRALAYLPQSSPRFPIPPRSQCTVSYLRSVSASAHARIISAARPPFNRNSRKYAYVRSGPRHSKPAAAPYRLRCVSCSVTRSDDLCTIRSLSG
ncbi:hypothetical protein DFH08DRAFT_97229 [Mycena albidolilacea]|uniref:Uncharacterized protein n=1 Tax=Mycena albidolilacea TaxID=1033008 RepID=A0AAD7A776_9AGAR|nr:hypothetical protein DFH08DRAFT_97229 [Mycena albidolilacea]